MTQKRINSRKFATISAAVLLLSTQVALGYDRENTYEVTITNLTAGQPFSPPVLATHTRSTEFFSVGENASAGIQAIAENGDNGPLVAALNDDDNVYQMVVGNAPLVPGSNPANTPFESSASFTISSRGKARFLSIANMLICTNDGFTGIDTVRLPYWERTVYAVGYDARTEKNTEDFADIVTPCQGLIGISSDDPGTGESNPLLIEGGFIIPHAGVSGDDDLETRVHDWADPVAKIVIRRVRN